MTYPWNQLINSGNQATPTPTQGGSNVLPNTTTAPPITGNVNAVSGGGGSPFGVSPVGGDPNILGKLAGLTYSVPAGGYITNEEANNSNSAQNKYGIQDPVANQLAKSIFAYIGSLPTTANTTSALASLYAREGRQAPLGPSLNDTLAKMYGEYGGAMSKAGFGATYQGPWAIQPEHPSSTPRTSYGGYG